MAPELKLTVATGRGLVNAHAVDVADDVHVSDPRLDVRVHWHTRLVCTFGERSHGRPDPVAIHLEPVANAVKRHFLNSREFIRDIILVVEVAVEWDGQQILLHPRSKDDALRCGDLEMEFRRVRIAEGGPLGGSKGGVGLDADAASGDGWAEGLVDICGALVDADEVVALEGLRNEHAVARGHHVPGHRDLRDHRVLQEDDVPSGRVPVGASRAARLSRCGRIAAADVTRGECNLVTTQAVQVNVLNKPLTE